MYEGKKTLGVRLSWDKRYITLAPVATLIGLAFHLHDPEHLLGDTENIGITLALVPADHPGVEIGRRHYRARGVHERAGEAQRLHPHRFPDRRHAICRAGLAHADGMPRDRPGHLAAGHRHRVDQARAARHLGYARIRRQFGIAVGIMEGVAEPLSRMVRSAYTFEAARALTASMVDEGQKPAVISALLKYRTTDAMRDRVNDALDIHGGRALQDGPSNYLFSGYMTTPVAITVEGANILTRTLITFAQGALRAHPYLYAEIAAAQDKDRKAGIAAFDTAFGGHVRFMLRNIAGSFLHGLTFGRFASSPVSDEMAIWYRQVARYAQSFALVGDWTVIFLGGDLKRKQRLSGRMADILSDLYLLSAVLKRYADEGALAEDRPLVEAIAKDHVFAIEQSFAAVFANFPNPVLRWLMRFLVFPLGRHARPASDRETYRLARAVLRPGPFRDRLTLGTYVTMDPKDVTGVLEDAFVKVTRAEEVEAKFVKAIKKGQIERRLDRDAITDAVDAGILTEAEAATLRLADQATDRAIRVDDFDPDELVPRQLARRPDEQPVESAAE